MTSSFGHPYLTLHLTLARSVVAFNFEVEAVLQCAEFDRAEQALQEFSAGTTPMMLLWPYVRPYMNIQMYQMGLPDFHLPLVLRWEQEGDKFVSEVKGKNL